MQHSSRAERLEKVKSLVGIGHKRIQAHKVDVPRLTQRLDKATASFVEVGRPPLRLRRRTSAVDHVAGLDETLEVLLEYRSQEALLPWRPYSSWMVWYGQSSVWLFGMRENASRGALELVR